MPKRAQGERAQSSQTPRRRGWEQPELWALKKKGHVGNTAV